MSLCGLTGGREGQVWSGVWNSATSWWPSPWGQSSSG